MEAGETFLRNYLVAVAGQLGVLEPASELDTIRANVEVTGNAGIAILTSDGKALVQTRYFPESASIVPDLGPELQMMGPAKAASGEFLLWIAAPIRGVQDSETDAPLAWAVIAMPIHPALDDRLKDNQFDLTKATSRVISMADGKPQVIAPKRMTQSLVGSLQFIPVAQRAVDKPNELVEGENTESKSSFAFGVPIQDAPWTVVRQITTDNALAEVNKRISWLYFAYWAAVLAISFVIVALWRHVTAERLQTLLSNLSSHEALLELITNHIPARIMITDAKHRFCYANEQAQHALDMSESDLQKKSMSQVMGNARAQHYISANERVLAYKKPETILREQATGGVLESAYEVQHIPLAEIPRTYVTEDDRGVLIIERDLTDIIRSKQARQATLNKLIETLVMLIDRRDPHAAHHSASVALIAGEIANTMDLPTTAIETVEIAGQLMNLGKLLVPQELLVSAKPLGQDDRDLIQRCLNAAIDYLSHVPFEGPVVETLRQSQERVDGKGPLGLLEEDILETALVLAVANSFVALTSPRAWREAKPIEEAKVILQEESGKEYSRPVVTALCHYLENLGGQDEWEQHLKARL
jgi:HD-GYP domain-containing protein (c-di-GMP phosphodiesterase class II)